MHTLNGAATTVEIQNPDRTCWCMKIAYRYRLADGGRRRRRQRTGAHGKKKSYMDYMWCLMCHHGTGHARLYNVYIPAPENGSAPTTQRQRHSIQTANVRARGHTTKQEKKKRERIYRIVYMFRGSTVTLFMQCTGPGDECKWSSQRWVKRVDGSLLTLVNWALYA